MSVQVEKLEKNMAKLTVEVPAEEVEKALQAAPYIFSIIALGTLPLRKPGMLILFFSFM